MVTPLDLTRASDQQQRRVTAASNVPNSYALHDTPNRRKGPNQSKQANDYGPNPLKPKPA